MHSVWKTSILFTLVTAVLLGIGYPLVVTGIAGVIFPHKAAGSLILKDGQVIGSELLAQSFTSDRTFIPVPRLRATATTPPPPAARIWPSPTRRWSRAFRATSTSWPRRIPASPCPSIWSPPPAPASIPTSRPTTPTSRRRASPRRAASARISVRKLIAQHITGRQLGLLGEPRVNVLDLNLALDKMGK